MQFLKKYSFWIKSSVTGLATGLGCSGCLLVAGLLFPPLWLLIPFVLIASLLAAPGALKKEQQKKVEQENQVLLNKFLKDQNQPPTKP